MAKAMHAVRATSTSTSKPTTFHESVESMRVGPEAFTQGLGGRFLARAWTRRLVRIVRSRGSIAAMQRNVSLVVQLLGGHAKPPRWRLRIADKHSTSRPSWLLAAF